MSADECALHRRRGSGMCYLRCRIHPGLWAARDSLPLVGSDLPGSHHLSRGQPGQRRVSEYSWVSFGREKGHSTESRVRECTRVFASGDARFFQVRDEGGLLLKTTYSGIAARRAPHWSVWITCVVCERISESSVYRIVTETPCGIWVTCKVCQVMVWILVSVVLRTKFVFVVHCRVVSHCWVCW